MIHGNAIFIDDEENHKNNSHSLIFQNVVKRIKELQNSIYNRMILMIIRRLDVESKIFPNHIVPNNFDNLEWKSGLAQYTFDMSKKPVPTLLNSSVMSDYFVHIDIKDTIGRTLCEIDFLQMQFINMIISMMLWICMIVDEDYTQYFQNYVSNGTNVYIFRIGMNYSFDSQYHNELKESLYFDEYAEMYRDFYFEVYKIDTTINMNEMLIARIPVSICDLYFLIDTGLTLTADTDLSAGVLQQIGDMFNKIEEICMI